MAKSKGEEAKVKRITNPHLHARVAYLHRASAYLASLPQHSAEGNGDDAVANSTSRDDGSPHDEAKIKGQPLSRLLATSLRSVARKSQIRLSGDIKHSICKVCDAHLIEGETGTTYIENQSRGGRKLHAMVKVVQCNACDAVKRFPIGAKQQARKTARNSVASAV